MSETQEVKFSLKAMINKEKTKVLFAEADRDLGDVLLSFLTLPLGTIMRILEKHYGYESAPVIGSLTSLRRSLANLNDVHFWTKECKLMLLNPISSLEDECRKLKLNIDHDAQPIKLKYFICETSSSKCLRSSGVSIYYDTIRCKCGKSMNRELGVRESNTQTVDDGVFTKKTVSFAISDDLQIAPNVTGSIIQILCNFGITDIDGAEQITVTLGLNEIVDLLKGALVSKTPLTDLILNERHMDLQFESSTVMHKMEEESNSKKMVIEAIVQKSSKKLLFAIAKEDFIDFLFSLLTIPLGGVASLVGSNTRFGSINNLCRSIENLNGDVYLKTKDTKSMLLKPELPPMYLSKNQILPLVEQKTPSWNFYPYADTYDGSIRFDKLYSSDVLMCFNDPKGEGSYVMGPGMFMVADDLTVTPLSMLSSVSVLNGLKIPLSDVEEIEFEIGLEEALNIIRASLTSTCALTNGLMIKSVLMKKPKEEQ